MRNVIATLVVDVDVEDDATEEEIQNDVVGVMLDLLNQGCEITITEGES